MPEDPRSGKQQDRQPFAAFLRDHAKGELDRVMAEQLEELVRAVTETGKGGSLTLTLSVRMVNKPRPGDTPEPGEPVIVEHAVKAKLPEPDLFTRPYGQYWPDDGRLSRRPAVQPDVHLPLDAAGYQEADQ